MRRRWLFWVGLFDQKELGTSLALFRISLGLVALYSLLSIAAAGLVGPLWTSVQYGGMRALGGNWLVQYLGGPTPNVIWALWGVAVASSIAFVLGLGGPVAGRVVTFVMLQSYNALATMNPLASGSYDALLSNGLWVLVFADATATLSVYARWRKEGWLSKTLVCAWPRYILIFQLLLMYSFTGLQKAAHIWTPGGGYTALYYYRYTADRGGRVRTWALRRDWRLGWACVGLSMHIGILLLMNVGPFSWVSMSYYFLLWTPAEWAKIGRRMRDWWRRTFVTEDRNNS